MTTRDIIDYAANDNAVEFRKEMYAAIHDKVSAHIENRKQELAQGLVTQSEAVEHPPIAVRSLYTQTYAKHGGTAKESNAASEKAYAAVEKKHGKSMSDKLKAYHASNRNMDEEVEELDEEAGQFRLVSKHGAGKHTAKVYKDREWGEYRVRHYKDGAHMGEDSDSHHDDLKDAQGSAEHAVKHMDKHYQ